VVELNDLIAAILIGLATFAITYLVQCTDGPFNIFNKFRLIAGIRTETYNKGTPGEYAIEVVDDKFFAKLVSCWWCMSTWVALVLTLVTLSHPVAWPAAIGLAGLMHKIVED